MNDQELPATNSYCLWCAKTGHYSHECRSTHGLNTPADQELSRLTDAAIEAGRQQGVGQELQALRQALESKLGRGATYTERDLEMFALGVGAAPALTNKRL